MAKSGDRYNCFFVGYSGEYSSIIKNSIFEYIQLKLWLTKEKTEPLWQADRMESFADPFTKVELGERFQREIGIINKSSKPKLNRAFRYFFQRLQAILLRCELETAS